MSNENARLAALRHVGEELEELIQVEEQGEPQETMPVIHKQELMGIEAVVYGGENEVWMTRMQIGEYLEYKDPLNAIMKIHMRNKERLDKWSRVGQIVTPLGGKQEMILYSPKGIYEICRLSNQPKANEFFDQVYDMLEAVRVEGYYSRIGDVELMNKVMQRIDANSPKMLLFIRENATKILDSMCEAVGMPAFDYALQRGLKAMRTRYKLP